MHALPHTVEELTAAQLRKVFNFIATAPARAIPQAPADSSLLTTTQQQQAATVVYHLRQLDDALQCATSIFLNVQTFLFCSVKVEVKYVKFMAYIHALQHASTGIITHRDLISDALLPNLFARSQPFLDALSTLGISETLITEKSMAASAVVAHATRLIRILEYHQLSHVMTRQKEKFAAVDEEYRRLAIPPEPEQLPVEPRTYVQALRWWQQHHDDILHRTLTDEYLELNQRDEPATQEHRQPAEEQLQPDVQQQETSIWEQPAEQEERHQPGDQQQQVVTTIMAAHKISALSTDVQPEELQ
ncbi:unnamed protein product, partial [Cylicostephanus goldi]